MKKVDKIINEAEEDEKRFNRIVSEKDIMLNGILKQIKDFEKKHNVQAFPSVKNKSHKYGGDLILSIYLLD